MIATSLTYGFLPKRKFLTKISQTLFEQSPAKNKLIRFVVLSDFNLDKKINYFFNKFSVSYF
jgi:hypothetical protein